MKSRFRKLAVESLEGRSVLSTMVEADFNGDLVPGRINGLQSALVSKREEDVQLALICGVPRLGSHDSVHRSFRSDPHRNELVWRKSASPKSFRSIPRTESAHEEGLARGAFPVRGISADPVVNTRRGE